MPDSRIRFNFAVDLGLWMARDSTESAEFRRRYYRSMFSQVDALVRRPIRELWSEGRIGGSGLPTSGRLDAWVTQNVFQNFNVALEAVERPAGMDDVTYYLVVHNGQEMWVCVHTFLIRRPGAQESWLMSIPPGLPQRQVLGMLAVDMGPAAPAD